MKLLKTTILTFMILFIAACSPQNEQSVSYLTMEDVLEIEDYQKNNELENESDVDEQVNEALQVDDRIPEEAPLVTGASIVEDDVQLEYADPVIEEDIPKKVIKEGDIISFPNLQAVDPDGDAVTYIFTEPLDSKGEWQTKIGDAGEYLTSITISDGQNEVVQDVLLVVEKRNNAPTLTGLPDITVKEGETVLLSPSIEDSDGDSIVVSYSGWMTSAEKETDYNDAGTYVVTVTVSDGIDEVSEKVKVTVENVNRRPQLDDIEPISVLEGETVELNPVASDPDNEDLEFFYTDPFSEDGIWETAEGDAGTYVVEVTVSDGNLVSDTDVMVEVLSLNKPPVLELIAPMVVNEGETIILSVTAVDPEGEEVEITYSGFMDQPRKTTGYNDAGEHTVTITASDGVKESTADVSITVLNTNRPPVFIDII